MCLAIPGKIVRLEADEAVVDYGYEQRSARLIEDNAVVGDYVIVQGGFVIEKISAEEAEKALSLYAEATK